MEGDDLTAFLELLHEPEILGTSLTLPSTKGCAATTAAAEDDPSARRRVLLEKTCQALFRRLDRLGDLYTQRLADDQDTSSSTPATTTLSGISELYLPPSGHVLREDGAETLYGQIETQNKSLCQLLKKANKKIQKAASDGEVQLLMGVDSEDGEDDDDDDDDDEDDDDDDDDENDASSVDGKEDEEVVGDEDDQIDDDEDGDGDEEDDEARRIRKRMEQAMKDMEDDDMETDRDDAADNASPSEEDLEDPAADELNDGFFNIQDMEQFADEEEEYLPDEAFGEEKPEEETNDSKDKRSFHQRLRDGDYGREKKEESDDDSEEDEEDEGDGGLLFRAPSTVRRKRYREEDEIDALFELYQPAKTDDDDEELDAANMTALDFFGQPNKKYFDKWQNREKANKAAASKGDDDSWDDYEFNKNNQKSGWNDDDEVEEGSGEDEDGGDEDEDETIPLKPAAKAGGKSQIAPFVHDKKKQKLLEQTRKMEQDLIAEKPWQMKGEVSSMARPIDSLLDSTPEFEVAAKQAPVITEEKNFDLEEVIKKRILEEDWDDVIPRELPDVAWNKKRGELPDVSQEKSKLSLGELYEREYLKKVAGYDVDASEKESELDKAKNEMRTLFANLCSKLDALSNYHFAPRPIADEAELRVVTKPAIAMEEVLPLHVSDARTTAPEEVYGAKRGREGVLQSESEMEQSERKRLRAAKKQARRKARKEKESDEKLISRLQPGLGLNNPYEKRKARQELANARAHGKVTAGEADTNDYGGGSNTFFKRMQAEVRSAIRGGGDTGVSANEQHNKNSNASLKL